MAVAAIVERKGDPKELLKQYDEISPQVFGLGPQPGHLSHTCIELPDGIRIVNVFASEGEARAFGERPAFREIFHAAGLPDQKPEILKVHNSVAF